MARLNEPPIAPAPSLLSNLPAGESLEAQVKRRFIRQNRELAKNNSAQSLKIRGLESEVSKLLVANLELRERCLKLEGARGRKNGDGGIGRMQRDLRRKLEELRELLDGLPQSQEDDGEEEEDGRGYEVDLKRVLSPSHQQYRERQPLGELMRDSQMPTISEGKSYPRQTLDASEVRTIRISDGSAATGSPDLGPPPVARFDCEKEGEDLLPSVNLETRRRRKDGSSEREMRRSSILPLSPVKLDVGPAAPSMLRTGAKRKLADREGEKVGKKDDFSFTRKPAVEAKREDENEHKAPASPGKTTRRVLSDKSVNQSPRKSAPVTTKPAKPANEEPIKLSKPAPRSQPTTVRPPSRGRRTSSAPQVQPDAPITTSIELPPATPAPMEDPFSPVTASVPQASKDTPPPTDLSSLNNTTTETRPSRRARSSVNYAEPSLVAKMRRPGKGMVDAISGLPAAGRRSVSVDASVIKVEAVDDDESWKTAGHGSPSVREKTMSAISRSSDDDDKMTVVQPQPMSRRESSSVVTESRRKREAISRRSSSTNSSSPPLRNVVETTMDKLADLEISEKEKKKAEMDIFEFKDEGSSPVTVAGSGMGIGKGRRHSSVLKDVGGGKIGAVGGKGVDGAKAVTAVGSRRRSMML